MMRPPSLISGRRLGEEEHALEVDVHQRVEFLLGRLGDRLAQAGAGIVDEIVEAVALPVFLQRLLQCRDEGRECGDGAGVERERGGTTACGLDLGDGRLRLVGARTIGEDDVDALAGEVERGVAAEAAAAAGDEGDGASGHGEISFVAVEMHILA